MQRYRVTLERTIRDVVIVTAPSAGAARAFAAEMPGFYDPAWNAVELEREWSFADNEFRWFPVPKSEWRA